MSASESPAAIADLCHELGRRARAASRILATTSTAVKNRWLLQASENLAAQQNAIIAANALEPGPSRRIQADRCPDRSPAADAGADPGRRQRLARHRRPARSGWPRSRQQRPAQRPAGPQGRRAARRASFSSTNRVPTSPSMPPACASRAATPSSCAAARRRSTPTPPCTRSLQTALEEVGLPADAVQLVDDDRPGGRGALAAS